MPAIPPTNPDVAASSPAAMVAAAKALPPGAARIALLDEINDAGLPPQLQLDMVEMWEESRRWLEARQQRPLAALAVTPSYADERWSAWEVAAALRVGESTAHDRLWTARALVGRLPRTLAALQAAQITYWQGYDIAAAAQVLSDEHALALEDRVLEQAKTQTRGETRKAVDKAVIAIDPQAAEERHKQRRRDRRVERPRPTGDGMAGSYIDGPIESLVGFYNVLTARGRAMKKAGMVDTLDQGRFDWLMAVVLAAANVSKSSDPADLPRPAPLPTRVGLLVKTTTTAGTDDEPGEIPGFGPVTAAVARRLAAGLPPEGDPHPRSSDKTATVVWDVLPINPATGCLARPDDPRLNQGRARRDVSPAQKRYLDARDRFCNQPGCNVSAERCDADHRGAGWAGGSPTDVDLMGTECGHHNRVTNNNGWMTIPNPDGTATIVSPLGRRYPVTPYRYWDP